MKNSVVKLPVRRDGMNVDEADIALALSTLPM